MLVMPVFLFLSAPQWSCGESDGPKLLVLVLESLSSFQYLCSFPCMYDRSYIYLSFKWCQTNRRGSSEFVLHTGNSLAGNPCVFASVCLSSVCLFVYSFVSSCNSSVMLTSFFHSLYFPGTWGNPP